MQQEISFLVPFSGQRMVQGLDIQVGKVNQLVPPTPLLMEAHRQAYFQIIQCILILLNHLSIASL